MKSCPACNHTYSDDTLTFCLVDGSILSPAYDPLQTQRIPTPQSTNSDRTEVLPPATKPSDPASILHPTIQSPQPPPLYIEKPLGHSHEKQSRRTWLAFCLGMLLVIIVGGIAVSLMWFGKSNAVDNKPNSNISVNKPKPAQQTNPDLSGNWESKYRPTSQWANCSITQEGNSLTFINEVGGKSKGRFLSPGEVVAEEWENGLHAKVKESGNRLEWANSSVWRRRT